MTVGAGVAAFAHRVWQHKGVVSTLLLPAALLTTAIARRRRARYLSCPDRAYHSTRPVIVVGNIYVGGTGKTPVVIAILDALKAAGWSPGLVSRGYGAGAGELPAIGTHPLTPRQFGDEPALIAQVTGVPVAVHPRRALAVQHLERRYPKVDVIVADDGLQHYALGRDIEIAVQDERGIGNGRLLPAGPLREPPERLNDVWLVITNTTASVGTRPPGMAQPPAAGHHAPVSMWLEPVQLRHLLTGKRVPFDQWPTVCTSPAIAAVAGIGRPERFFGMLENHGVPLQRTLALPDHAAIDSAALGSLDQAIILMTPKDAVKCTGLTDARLWVVETCTRFSDPAWLAHLDRHVVQVADRKSQLAPTP